MKLIFDADGAFRWEAVTAIATLGLMVIGGLSVKWPDRSSDASQPSAPAEAIDSDYTGWKTKSVAFRAAPASVASCFGTPPVSIRVLPLERAVEVNGTPLQCNEPVMLSETCRVTCVSLTAPRDVNSGGTVHYDYRTRK